MTMISRSHNDFNGEYQLQWHWSLNALFVFFFFESMHCDYLTSSQLWASVKDASRLNNLSINKPPLAQPFDCLLHQSQSRAIALLLFAISIERRRSVGAIYVFIIFSRCFDSKKWYSGPLATRAPRFSLLLPAAFYLIFIYISHCYAIDASVNRRTFFMFSSARRMIQLSRLMLSRIGPRNRIFFAEKKQTKRGASRHVQTTISVLMFSVSLAYIAAPRCDICDKVSFVLIDFELKDVKSCLRFSFTSPANSRRSF